MNLKIISLESFTKDVKALHKKYKSITKDLRTMERMLLADPKCGVHLGKSCYKIRLKNSSVPTGKSGGFRVIYYCLDEDYTLYLMAMYSKTELENISDEKIIDILRAYDL